MTPHPVSYLNPWDVRTQVQYGEVRWNSGGRYLENHPQPGRSDTRDGGFRDLREVKRSDRVQPGWTSFVTGRDDKEDEDRGRPVRGGPSVSLEQNFAFGLEA